LEEANKTRRKGGAGREGMSSVEKEYWQSSTGTGKRAEKGGEKGKEETGSSVVK